MGRTKKTKVSDDRSKLLRILGIALCSADIQERDRVRRTLLKSVADSISGSRSKYSNLYHLAGVENKEFYIPDSEVEDYLFLRDKRVREEAKQSLIESINHYRGVDQ